MARSQQTETRSNIRRRRTGCLTCRERRVRCGEEKPVCANCSRKSRACNWARNGDKFQHYLFSTSGPADERQQATAKQAQPREAVQRCRDISRPQLYSFWSTSPSTHNVLTQLPTRTVSKGSATDGLDSQSIDELHVVSPNVSYQKARSNSLRSSSSSNSLGIDELSCWRSEVLQSFNDDSSSLTSDLASSICRSQSARLKSSIDLEHESPIPPNLEPNAEVFSDWRSLGASDTVVDALGRGQEMKLLQTYLQECAHWFDALDSQRHYARKSVARMITCPPWRAAALALAAKHTELTQRKGRNSESLSLHLYQLAVQLAIDSISGRFDCVGTTAGCVILAVYEMMTVTYHDWRRHLQGCTSIYSHNHWNGESTGLIRASFWNYARIDIWAAFCAGTDTMLSTEKWFNHPNKMLEYPCIEEDRHAHIAIWLLARVNNFIHSKTINSNIPEAEIFSRLKTDLTRWEQIAPIISKPIIQRQPELHEDNPFPSTLFSNESSAIASILWHTARVLLSDYGSVELGQDCERSCAYELSRAACGIILTHQNSSSILVEAIHPLWICGGHLKTKSEKFAVLELLARIERIIGWKTAWRADSLYDKWGLS